ncbi:MAG: helix-turn-helix domain-containing protein [Propionibacteriaceae bacterium]|nr:helix-turn-helix domain-containing protein [Propionibacteriaceae bacterium]
MEDPPPARIDAERNRRALLTAAAGALALDPDASLSEVARAAGLTRATLYRHFASRERLLTALREDALAAARGAVAAARVGEGTSLEALRRVITALVALGGRFWPLLADGAAGDPDFVRGREAVFAPVLGIVQRGQDAGEIRGDLRADWAVTALMAVLAAGVREARGSAEVDVADRVLNTIAFGIHLPEP